MNAHNLQYILKLVFILTHNISKICNVFSKKGGKNMTYWKIYSPENRVLCISMDNN